MGTDRIKQDLKKIEAEAARLARRATDEDLERLAVCVGSLASGLTHVIKHIEFRDGSADPPLVERPDSGQARTALSEVDPGSSRGHSFRLRPWRTS